MTTIKAFIKKHPVLTYFVLTFVISGGGVLIVLGPGGLPITAEAFETVSPFALMAYLAGPSVAGILLTVLVSGKAGLREFLSRLLRWRVGARWYAVALLTAPLLATAVLLALSLFSREFLPAIFTADDLAAPLLSGITAGLMVGLFEELGWTGFAIPQMRRRYGVLTTGLVVGVLWGAWHFAMFWEADSFSGALPFAILLARLFSWLPAYRVLMVWVYDRTESLLLAVLMHVSVTASAIITAPLALTGVSLLTSILVGAAAWWLLVGAVAVADRLHLSRYGKPPADASHEEHTRIPATLTAVIKAVRLRYAIPFVLLLGAVYWTGIHPWMMNWGSTAAEQQMSLPGDELHSNRAIPTTQAITINAPSDGVWQWLVQVGQDRAGFYTYTWLENLIAADIHNADEIHPEWQHLAAGDAWRLAPPDYLWGLGKDAITPVLISEPGRALVLEMWGAWVIEPIDAHTSRLLVRGYSEPAGPVATVLRKMVIEPMVFTMQRRMLLGLQARAEGRPDSPALLTAVAQLGWAAAGVAVAGLFASQRRRRYWLVLPFAAALPALLMSSDVQAGLAAFLAVGITMLGFLVFGRSWWGAFLVIGSIVMLTLLLAPDAHIAIGLAFLLILLAALGAMVIARAAAPGATGRKLASSAR